MEHHDICSVQLMSPSTDAVDRDEMIDKSQQMGVPVIDLELKIVLWYIVKKF